MMSPPPPPPPDPRGPLNPANADLHSALSSRLEQLGYVAGPLPADREAVAAAYVAIQRARGHAVDRLPEDEREILTATIAALDERFCGEPDAQNTMQSGAPRGRWPRGHLTWSVDTSGLPAANWNESATSVNTIVAAIWDGFRPWLRAHRSFFDFTQVPSGGDIRFSFEPLAGANVLGRADFPDTAERGRVRLQSTAVWTRQRLAALVEHELGHTLGIKHSTVPNSTMSPFVANYAPLDADTANTLRDMYAWTRPARFADGRASSDGPALTTTHWHSLQQSATRVHMAWKGREGDSRIFVSSSGDEGLTWSPQVELPGIRSSQGPALTGYRRGAGSTHQDDIFMAWKGEGDDDRLFYSTDFNGSAFSAIHRLEGHTSRTRPAVAEFRGRVHLVWKASTGDHVLWSSWGGGQWTPVTVVPNVLTSHAPALTPFGDDLVLCWQGMGEDARLFLARLQGADGTWSAIQAVSFLDATAGVGNVINLVGSPVNTSHHPALTAVSGSIVIGYKGQPGDDAVWLLRGFGVANGPVHITDALSSTGPGLTAVKEKIICAWKAQAPDQELHFAIR